MSRLTRKPRLFGSNARRVAGASAVLLKMDEVQGRVGTPGALVRRGAKPESSVMAPVPAPVVKAVVPVATRKADAALAKPLLAALKATGHGAIKALAHITGGGFPDNLPRVLPDGVGIAIDLDAVTVPPVFGWLARQGNVAEAEMLRTFNCGIGMVVVVDPARAEAVEQARRAAGEAPVRLGQITPRGETPVTFSGTLAL